jgi:U3 small nucleolar RNA-associated protein 22
MSDQIPFEALELLLCHSYNDRTSPLDTPGTTVAGFLRFLNVVASHDWARKPLIVDPQHQCKEADVSAQHGESVQCGSERSSQPTFLNGPAMFIVSPGGRTDDDKENWLWQPSFTMSTPETVVLKRACVHWQDARTFLAKGTERIRVGGFVGRKN